VSTTTTTLILLDDAIESFGLHEFCVPYLLLLACDTTSVRSVSRLMSHLNDHSAPRSSNDYTFTPCFLSVYVYELVLLAN
jgi:hypothetical protein